MRRIVRHRNGGSFAIWHITRVFGLIRDNGVEIIFYIMAMQSGIWFGVRNSLFGVVNDAVVCMCFSVVILG